MTIYWKGEGYVTKEYPLKEIRDLKITTCKWRVMLLPSPCIHFYHGNKEVKVEIEENMVFYHGNKEVKVPIEESVVEKLEEIFSNPPYKFRLAKE